MRSCVTRQAQSGAEFRLFEIEGNRHAHGRGNVTVQRCTTQKSNELERRNPRTQTGCKCQSRSEERGETSPRRLEEGTHVGGRKSTRAPTAIKCSFTFGQV